MYPGPTALLLTAVPGNNSHTDPPFLKVEGMTDEFCCLTKIGDAMTQMNAVDAFGAMVDTSSYYCNDGDEDVNRTTAKQPQEQLEGDVSATDALQQRQQQSGKKRKRGSKSNATPVRKRKAAKAKKK